MEKVLAVCKFLPNLLHITSGFGFDMDNLLGLPNRKTISPGLSLQITAAAG